MKRIFIIALILGIAIVWEGSTQKVLSAPQETWLRIGAANPLSGPGAMWGLPCVGGRI